MVASIYGPIFSQIDPEEVGSRSRAMRIGEDYAKRLNQKWNNLKSPESVRILSSRYPSHGFVIDYTEACELFKNVRKADENEMVLVEDLGLTARFPARQPEIRQIDHAEFPPKGHEQDERRATANGADS